MFIASQIQKFRTLDIDQTIFNWRNGSDIANVVYFLFIPTVNTSNENIEVCFLRGLYQFEYNVFATISYICFTTVFVGVLP